MNNEKFIGMIDNLINVEENKDKTDRRVVYINILKKLKQLPVYLEIMSITNSNIDEYRQNEVKLLEDRNKHLYKVLKEYEFKLEKLLNEVIEKNNQNIGNIKTEEEIRNLRKRIDETQAEISRNTTSIKMIPIKSINMLKRYLIKKYAFNIGEIINKINDELSENKLLGALYKNPENISTLVRLGNKYKEVEQSEEVQHLSIGTLVQLNKKFPALITKDILERAIFSIKNSDDLFWLSKVYYHIKAILDYRRDVANDFTEDKMYNLFMPPYNRDIYFDHSYDRELTVEQEIEKYLKEGSLYKNDLPVDNFDIEFFKKHNEFLKIHSELIDSRTTFCHVYRDDIEVKYNPLSKINELLIELEKISKKNNFSVENQNKVRIIKQLICNYQAEAYNVVQRYYVEQFATLNYNIEIDFININDLKKYINLYKSKLDEFDKLLNMFGTDVSNVYADYDRTEEKRKNMLTSIIDEAYNLIIPSLRNHGVETSKLTIKYLLGVANNDKFKEKLLEAYELFLANELITYYCSLLKDNTHNNVKILIKK